MISIVIPYWKRELALQKSLQTYMEVYGKSLKNFKFIIVVDGCDPPDVSKSGLDILVDTGLPKKDGQLNACTTVNRGVELVETPILVLTQPEIMHAGPILLEMLEVLGHSDRAVVLGGAKDTKRCKQEDHWLQHSEFRNRKQPWLSMMKTSLFRYVGGFCEDYRNGRGWDEVDFINRLDAVGTEWRCVDEPHVIHDTRLSYRETGKIWTHVLPDNKPIFDAKWDRPDAAKWNLPEGCEVA